MSAAPGRQAASPRESFLLKVATSLIVILAAMPLWVEGASAQTLERIGSAGVIKIGYREDAPPFSFKTEIGEPAGYTVDLCRKIAADVKRELGLAEITVDYVAVGTDDRFQAVAEGKIDILCGATTATLSRRELVSFSLPTFVTGVSALLRADAPSFLREVLAGRRPGASARSSVRQALADRTFAVRANTTAETWLRESLATLAANAEMVSVESHEEGLALVLDKNADAYFADRAILAGLIALSDRPAEFEIADRFFTYEPYALALGKGDEAFRLSVDRTLSRLYRSGEIVQIFGEYFGVPGKAVRTLFQINSLPE